MERADEAAISLIHSHHTPEPNRAAIRSLLSSLLSAKGTRAYRVKLCPLSTSEIQIPSCFLWVAEQALITNPKFGASQLT